MTATEKSTQLARLCSLADLVLEARLTDLRSAAAARAASLDRLADLDRPADPSGLPDVAAADVAIRYQRWADRRRAEINLTLAGQTAVWIEARRAAALAFGKSQALAALSQKLR